MSDCAFRHGNIEIAVAAVKQGAYDFIEKPLSLEKVLLSIQNAMQIGQLVAENQALKEKISRDYEMIGESPVINKLKKQIEKELVEKAFRITGGNVAKTARILNVPRGTLRYKLEKYQLTSD